MCVCVYVCVCVCLCECESICMSCEHSCASIRTELCVYVCVFAFFVGTCTCLSVHVRVHACILCVHIYISRYHGKRGISLWVIRYIPQFELAVRYLRINHYCSL